jgi:excisionase family DNA binding protein
MKHPPKWITLPPMENTEFYTVGEAAKVLGISTRRVRQLAQDGKIEAERADEGWKLFRRSVHAFRDEKRQAAVSIDDDQLSETARDAIEEVKELRYQLGRVEGRLELTEVAETTLRETLSRERERADRLAQREQELYQELQKIRESWWYRLFH